MKFFNKQQEESEREPAKERSKRHRPPSLATTQRDAITTEKWLLMIAEEREIDDRDLIARERGFGKHTERERGKGSKWLARARS